LRLGIATGFTAWTKTFDLLYEHCTPKKGEARIGPIVFYTKEESCRGPRRRRQFAFKELETGITQANQVVEILKANPKTGPF